MTNPWVSEIVEKMARALDPGAFPPYTIAWSAEYDVVAQRQVRLDTVMANARAALLSCAEFPVSEKLLSNALKDTMVKGGTYLEIVQAYMRAIAAELSPGAG